MNKILTHSLLALGAALSVGSANATVIDFSSAPGGCNASYSESGVTFSAGPDGVTASNFGPTPNTTPGLISCNSGNFSPTTALFSSAFSGAISVDLGDFNADADDIFLRLFDAGNMLLASDTFHLDASFIGMHTLTANAANVAYAVFGGVGAVGSSVYADNFTFNSQQTVPEPGALLLVGTALAGLALLRRRQA